MPVPGQGGQAVRRPSDDDDDDEPSARGNLTWKDALWCLLHASLLLLDAWVLWELAGARSPRSARRFGGHTQFVATWSLAFSAGSHASLIYATLCFHPNPAVYHHPTRVSRDRAYEWTARAGALASTFCASAAMTHALLHALGERESWALGGAFPYVYADLLVPLDKLAVLALQRPRHWTLGPARYVLRRTELVVGSIVVGQSGVHAALSAYLAWLAACRLASGRWAYRALSEAEAASGTGAGFAAQCVVWASVVHLGGWAAWRLAAAVAPRPAP